MRAFVFPQPGQWRLEERPTPHPGPGQVLVRVEAAGVCGTDLHIYHNRIPARFPLVPGHEFAGLVEEIGQDVRGVEPGQLVSIEPNLPDLTCDQCRRGQYELCRHLEAFGVEVDGGFATHCVVPITHAFAVPPRIEAEEAALLEPIGCCLHGMERVTVRPGDTAVVIGAGWIGLIMLQLLRLRGVSQLIVSEPKAAKREQAARLGADLVLDPTAGDIREQVRDATGGGADIVVEVVGSAATAATALDLVGDGGTVLFFGVAPREAEVAVHPYDVYRRELTIVGSFSLNHNHQAAARLLAGGRLQVKPLITGRYPLEQAAEALGALERGEAIKSVLLPWR